MVVTVNSTQNRNQMLLRFHKEHPKVSYEQLGEMFAISKQRAWQLIRRGQVNKERKEKRVELFHQSLCRSIQLRQGVTGEIFALARPRQYYRRQLELKMRCMEGGDAYETRALRRDHNK